ncbi:MAG: beta-aspartyl-peptidase [Gammaproteobacteria bacterium]
MQLLTNANVYAPAPLGTQHLLIGAGKILWMGTERPALPAALNVREVDLEGLRVTPGFIDGHAHFTGGGGESGFASRVPPVALSRFTTAGVTTAVGVLGTDDVTRDTQSLLACTYGLREEGLSAYCHTGGYHLPPVTLTGSVRRDIVNLEPVIGVGEVAISDHRSSQPTSNELLRLAADAHVAGMMTGKAGILHLHLGDGERGLTQVRDALSISEIPARVFNPTHVNRRKALFTEACALTRQGCYIDLTAFPVAEDEDAWSAADGLQRYLEAGFAAEKITISSDGGGCLPHFNDDGEIVHMDIGAPATLAETLAELLHAGMPLEQALPAFTSNPAVLLRLAHKGKLGVDQDADLIVLDPQHGVRDVMAGGRWHVRDGDPVIKGQFEVAT